MINKVYNILNPLGLPIKWQTTPSFDCKSIVLSYHFFNEGDLLHGDGIDIENGGALQVDIYSKKDYSITVKEVKNLLRSNGFLFSDARDNIEQLDSNTNIYHKILIFNYIESEEI